MKARRYWISIAIGLTGIVAFASLHGRSDLKEVKHESGDTAAQADNRIIVAGILRSAAAPAGIQSEPAPVDTAAQRELARAKAAVRRAQQRVTDVEEELRAEVQQIRTLQAQETAAESREAEAAHDSEVVASRRPFGLASAFDAAEASAKRESVSVEAASLRSSVAAGAVDIDLRRAELIEARSVLANAQLQVDAAENAANLARRGAVPFSTGGIPSAFVWRYAVVQLPEADVMDIGIGQPALVTLDRSPAVELRAAVIMVAETPITRPEGVFYSVTLSVQDPGDAVFSDVPIHARLQRAPR